MGTLLRLRHDVAATDGVPRTGIVERTRLLCPQALQNFDERGRPPIALGMRQNVDAHHAELFGAPAADQIDSPPPAADVVQRGAHLGRHQRMEYRHVHGRIHADGVRLGQQRGRPRHGFQRPAQKIRLAAEPAPAADRKQKIEPRGLGRLRDLPVGVVLPLVRLLPVGTDRIHIAAIRHEDAELQRGAVVVGHGASSLYPVDFRFHAAGSRSYQP